MIRHSGFVLSAGIKQALGGFDMLSLGSLLPLLLLLLGQILYSHTHKILYIHIHESERVRVNVTILCTVRTICSEVAFVKYRVYSCINRGVAIDLHTGK